MSIYIKNKKEVEEIFNRLSLKIDNPVTELNYINEFTFCIAIILSAQSTDKSVNKATENLFKVAKTPEDILELGEERLKNFIKSIGLYNNKAKNIILLSQILVRDFNSSLPRNRDVLLRLPGIGRKSANVIANNLFGVPCIAVDTHVLRVSQRLGLSRSSTPIGVERELMNAIPRKYHKNASNLLVLHDRYVCTAKNPRCHNCILPDICEYYHNNQGK